MKKWMVCCLAALLFTGCSNDTITQDRNALPENAQALLAEHFEGTLDWVKVDKELLRKDTYEVRFTEGTEIDFDRDGNWKEISGKGGVPVALVPLFASDYVQQHYPEQKIVSIERNNSIFEIELTNDLSLRFDKQGRMIQIDD